MTILWLDFVNSFNTIDSSLVKIPYGGIIIILPRGW